MGLRLAAMLFWLVLGLVSAAAAQPARPGFLYLNQERILTGSERGKALLAEEDAAREKLRAEAQSVQSAFEAEEQQLTERRKTMSAADFRALADDFDARVVEARRQQDERATALAQEFDQKRRQFYAGIGSILVSLMERLGALAIFDETSVLVADQTLNITDEVIAEIDRSAPTPTPPDAAPAPAPDGTGAAPGAPAGGAD